MVLASKKGRGALFLAPSFLVIAKEGEKAPFLPPGKYCCDRILVVSLVGHLGHKVLEAPVKNRGKLSILLSLAK